MSGEDATHLGSALCNVHEKAGAIPLRRQLWNNEMRKGRYNLGPRPDAPRECLPCEAIGDAHGRCNVFNLGTPDRRPAHGRCRAPAQAVVLAFVEMHCNQSC